MKRLTLLVVLILVFTGCSNSNKSAVKINFTDKTTQNKDNWYGHDIKEGNVQIDSMRPHNGDIFVDTYFKGWKPYEKIEVYREGGTLKIYYTEKNVEVKENVVISFTLGFHAYKENTEVYRNGVLQKENVKFTLGME